VSRSQRASLAEETLRILEARAYVDERGRRHDLSAAIEACLGATRSYPVEDAERLRVEQRREDACFKSSVVGASTAFEVANETTLAGLRRLLDAEDAPVAVLNFASAKNPGGGFLGGSQAQEESLARSSALYASLRRVPEFYERHRASPSLLYSDAMIHSPACPVFRDDDGRLLDAPHFAGFITCAAPNAGAIADNRSHETEAITATLEHRAEGVLALAAACGYRRLLLGAWGCGVFRNDPNAVAGVFAAHLRHGAYVGRFDAVRFSVLDVASTPHIFEAFARSFGNVR